MCKYCDRSDNDFVLLHDTKEYSGIEIVLNRQGMLRVRYYEDYNQLWLTEDIIKIKFCPMCGRKMDGK